MSKLQRLALWVLLIWLLAAVCAWAMLSPPVPLVGGKIPAPSFLDDEWRLARPNLADSQAVLEAIPLWGVSRNGSPLQKPKPKEEEEQEKLVVWRFVAAIERSGERYVLIVVGADPLPKTVREGEELPNGGKLLRLDAKSVTYLDRDGRSHSETLSF